MQTQLRSGNVKFRIVINKISVLRGYTRKRVNKFSRAGALYKFHNRIKIGINGKQYFAHRIIFLWHHGYLSIIIDHIDRDTLNDKIENLRAATRKENQGNRTKTKNKSSKYLGVFLDKRTNIITKKWRASCNKVFSSYFSTEAEAALAYNKLAVKYHGEFANLNIIQP